MSTWACCPLKQPHPPWELSYYSTPAYPLSEKCLCSPGSSVHGILQARILEWVAIPFSGLSTWFRDQTRVSCIADRFFTIWAMREHPLWKSQVRDYLLQESPGPARNLLPQELPSTRNYLLQEPPGPPARPVEDAQCSSRVTSCSVRHRKENESASRPVMSDSLWPHGLWPSRHLCPWDSPGKNPGVSCHALLQGIFPTQGSNVGLSHCRQALYRLSHQSST